MSIPESIPEDEEFMAQCERCKSGNIRFYLHTQKWECDSCDWTEDMEKRSNDLNVIKVKDERAC